MPDLGLLKRHTELLLGSARELTDTSAPSLCTGWSRGHVLTHIARNADGMAALCRSALEGTGETMYRSDESRDSDIEAGAHRPVTTLVDDVATSAAVLDPLLTRLGPEHADLTVERTPGGHRFRVGDLIGLRLREVVYHHVDLATAFTFADVEADLVAAFLNDEYLRLGAEPGHAARAADLLWRARGIRD